MERKLNRKVLLGVSGSIAAFKAAALVRELVKAGAEVQVVMTRAAHDFVTPLTLATLSGRPVLTDMVSGEGTWNDHVHLARWADVMLIAPMSANTLSKLAHGQCDNLLIATYLSMPDPREGGAPVYVAPAMDLEMYRDASTHANLELLRARGVRQIGPESGDLASGLSGEGRMSEPEAIVARLHADLVGQSKLNGRSILVSAGGTQEAIDPVRYIGNRSSGKMGFALAEEAALRGATVRLVAGPTALRTTTTGIHRTDVVSAAEMAEACKALAVDCEVVIMSAAVADYRPKHPATEKIKKAETQLHMELEPTEDILAYLGAHKPAHQRLVGFALETTDGEAHAQGKLERKNLDLIVLNTLQDPGAGFGHDTNKVTLIGRKTKSEPLALMSKVEVARAILDRIETLL